MGEGGEMREGPEGGRSAFLPLCSLSRSRSFSPLSLSLFLSLSLSLSHSLSLCAKPGVCSAKHSSDSINDILTPKLKTRFH